MKTSELRTKIRIQKPITTGTGINKKTVFADIGNSSPDDKPREINCKWYPLSGAESWIAESNQSIDNANVVIHFRNDVNSRCRLIKDGIIYNIINLNDPDQHKRWLKFKVKAAINS